jgi:AraC family transcriptional regulator
LSAFGPSVDSTHTPPSRSSFGSITLGRIERDLSLDGVRIVQTLHVADLRLPRHDHEDASFSIVLSGVFAESIGRSQFECARGSVLYKPRGTEHANRYGPRAARTVLVQLSRDLLGEGDLANAGHIRRRTSLGTAARIQTLLAAPAEHDDARMALHEFVAALVASTSEVPATPTTRDAPAWLLRVREELAESTRSDLRLSSIARASGVDSVTLCRRFTSTFGCPPSQFLRERRVGRAAEAIAHGRDPLSMIAASCGFADQAHLTRVFRAVTGVTPGRFRGLVSHSGPT